jgi:hypothetical protein
MFSVDLSNREWDSHVVVALSEEFDPVDAEAALAPQQPVLPVLVITGLVDDFSVHASAEEAAANARRSRQVVVPLPRPPALQSAAPNMARRDPATVILFPRLRG